DINAITLNGISIAASFLSYPADPDMSYAQISIDTALTYDLVSTEPFIATKYVEYDDGSAACQITNIGYPVTWPEFSGVPVDTVDICDSSATLTATAGVSYWWSTNDTTQSI